MTAALVMLLFIVLLVIGVPVFISMGITGFLGLFVLLGPDQAVHSFSTFVWQSSAVFELTAIPLFVLTGTLIEQTGAGEDLLNFSRAWIGGIPNALGVAVIATSAFFAAISGSSVANAATLSVVAIPLLAREGYPASMRGGVVAAGGTLGILIPPSIPMILYGVLTNTSIGQLFVAGILPGVILAAAMAVYLMLVARQRIARSEPALKGRWAITWGALPIVALPVVILAAIFTGYITPTEVGALSVVYVLILGIVKRRLSVVKVYRAAKSAVMTTTMLIMLVTFGILFSQYLSLEQIPQTVAGWVAGVSRVPVIVLTAMIVVYILMGTFLEAGAMLILSIPIFFPIASAIGLNPIQFGVFAIMNQEIAQIHPPLGVNLITVSGTSKIPVEKVMWGVLPYIVLELAMLYVVYLFPQLVLWLPQHMMKLGG